MRREREPAQRERQEFEKKTACGGRESEPSMQREMEEGEAERASVERASVQRGRVKRRPCQARRKTRRESQEPACSESVHRDEMVEKASPARAPGIGARERLAQGFEGGLPRDLREACPGI